MTHSRHIPLRGSYNIRDLGGYAGRGGPIAWRRFLRADSLHRLDEEATGALSALGVATVIDLRHEGELEAMPNPFAAGAAGVAYHNVSLFEGLDPALPHIAAAEDLLLALYREALDNRGAAVVAVMRIMAEAPGAVLFHCTAGKDRTGVIAALILLLAGAGREEVIADYALTGDYSGQMFDALHAELLAAGGEFDRGSRLLLSEAATMGGFLDHLDAAHGGAEAYLRRHGLGDQEIDALRARLDGGGLSQGIN
ncbi:MAG: tyrosine-protein phosphatase [Pikeienuella sp.]